MYSFILSDKHFMNCSSVYDVYDDCDCPITKCVVGYDCSNNIYYFTEYRGYGPRENFLGIRDTSELINILYDFSQLFELMDYPDIFSNMSVYYDYKDVIPPISKDKLYIYDGDGIVRFSDGEWVIMANDKYVNDLIQLDILEGQQFLLEDDGDGNDLFVDLTSDPFYCAGDEINGFYLYIKDWEKLKTLALVNNN
jgi:hypothetical protein